MDNPISTSTISSTVSADAASTTAKKDEKDKLVYYVVEFDDPGNSTEIEGGSGFEFDGLMLNDSSIFLQHDQPWDR